MCLLIIQRVLDNLVLSKFCQTTSIDFELHSFYLVYPLFSIFTPFYINDYIYIFNGFEESSIFNNDNKKKINKNNKKCYQ